MEPVPDPMKYRQIRDSSSPDRAQLHPFLSGTEKQILWENQKKRFLKKSNNWDKLTPDGLDQLWNEALAPDLWGQLLDKRKTPDHPDLAKRVITDLKKKGVDSFGSRKIHTKMTREQMAACLKALPQLSQSHSFVFAWIRTLRNPEPVTEDGVFLAQAWSFLADLSTVHNRLKANVLYHYLAWEQKRGVYNKERFIAYLKLPRSATYMDGKYLSGFAGQTIDLEWQPGKYLSLPSVGRDKGLVWDFLAHFLRGKDNFLEFLPYVEDVELRRLFVAENLISNTGDPAQLAAQLDQPEFLEELKSRVDLNLLITNKQRFSSDELVQLDVNIKNVPTLLVKIYEVNTVSYYRTKNEEIPLRS